AKIPWVVPLARRMRERSSQWCSASTLLFLFRLVMLPLVGLTSERAPWILIESLAASPLASPAGWAPSSAPFSRTRKASSGSGSLCHEEITSGKETVCWKFDQFRDPHQFGRVVRPVWDRAERPRGHGPCHGPQQGVRLRRDGYGRPGPGRDPGAER